MCRLFQRVIFLSMKRLCMKVNNNPKVIKFSSHVQKGGGYQDLQIVPKFRKFPSFTMLDFWTLPLPWQNIYLVKSGWVNKSYVKLFSGIVPAMAFLAQIWFYIFSNYFKQLHVTWSQYLKQHFPCLEIMKKKLPRVYDAGRHVTWSQYLKQHCHVSDKNRILPCVYDASRHVTWSQYLKQHCPCFRYEKNLALCVWC